MTSAHETILTIDLGILKKNYLYLKSQLDPKTKTIAVVKAYAYGMGDVAIAQELDRLGVDAFWVADFEEGISLREGGIQKPIIIANPGSKSMAEMQAHRLEPVIYNFRLLELYGKAEQSMTVHLKFNTGMNRYGFEAEQAKKVFQELAQHPQLKLGSICSHLAASDKPSKDVFTQKQIERFKSITTAYEQEGYPKVDYHLLNSNGVLRFPEQQMEMVRLGIGLYGLNQGASLQQPCTLSSTIAQHRLVKSGEHIGYQLAFTATEDMKIAVVPLGYADGFNRRLGEGKGRVLIAGKECPILGHISMDSFIVDVSHVEAKEGDEVIIFSPNFPIEKVAEDLGTIPYEVLATLNRRIKRIYLSPSNKEC